ncbi:hypothetical protein ACFQPF_18200 [Fictibacillus iocasae]|uniref:Uncharacterized protein n=1 Tax=Fictibacillus iocasae TaxID=2715437 RepID=A0ABW2NSQ5_9BACL
MTKVNQDYNETPYFRTYVTNVFSVLFVLYGIVMLVNKPVWGTVIAVSGGILWRMNSRGSKLKSLAVLLAGALLFLLISRLFWYNGLQVMNTSVLFVLQAFYFTGTVFGLGSLYSVLTSMDKSVEKRPISKYVVHGVYFLTGLLILPYCLFYFYGIIIFEGVQPELLLPVAIFFCWLLLYIVQTTIFNCSKRKAWSGISLITVLTLYVVTRWAEII